MKEIRIINNLASDVSNFIIDKEKEMNLPKGIAFDIILVALFNLIKANRANPNMMGLDLENIIAKTFNAYAAETETHIYAKKLDDPAHRIKH